MKNLKITLLVMLMFCAQSLKSQNILSPEKVFNLYFDSFVKYNDDSVKELNSYLINFLGKESTYRISLKNIYDKKTYELTKMFLSNLSVEMASACKNEAHNYFSVLMNNFKNVQYTIKSVKPVSNENMKNHETSEIIYEASFKIPSKIGAEITESKKIGAAEMKKYLTDLAAQFKNADKTVTIIQKFDLHYAIYGRDVYYWHTKPQEMNKKLEEFYFKNIN